jgi:hypothetical protein
MMPEAAMREEGVTWDDLMDLCWCAEVEVSQEEQTNYFVHTQVLVEKGIGHRTSIEDKGGTVDLKSSFGGEWMHEGASE